MIKQHDFLFELLTEELPPKALKQLSASFTEQVMHGVRQAGLGFSSYQSFATPRRLGILIHDLDSRQTDRKMERKGPAIQAAYDAEGKPSKAALGFAQVCGVSFEELTTLKNEKGEWLYYLADVPGKTVIEILPLVISEALNKLPVPKLMSWGKALHAFIRPVHNVMMLYGPQVVPGDYFGLRTNNHTSGHRFHHLDRIPVHHIKNYEADLEKAYVIVDFEKRKKIIRSQVEEIAKEKNAIAIIPENLLDEVTSLVEWPVALLGEFEKDFLSVPKEALILSMQTNQKYFALMDQEHQLLPYFITVSNIKSFAMHNVISGNQRVIRARFSDAAFFFKMDKKIKLADRVNELQQIVFQKQLGTLLDKTNRVKQLSVIIAEAIGADKKLTERAAYLSKADLLTQMVGEFPELQGVMGRYYAAHDDEDPSVSKSLDDQYCPRFSGDRLPEQAVGQALALADRIDTLVGIFGINILPTGDKDPFGLRRAALGVLRILIEKELSLNLTDLINASIALYGSKLTNKECAPQLLHFFTERLRFWAQEKGIRPDVFAAVAALNITIPLDCKRRMDAVNYFLTLPQAKDLASANKRVSNILAKESIEKAQGKLKENLLIEPAERTLAEAITLKQKEIEGETYQMILKQLAELQQPVTDFFDHVMVMAEDEKLRQNRLILLELLRKLFCSVADISLLQ